MLDVTLLQFLVATFMSLGGVCVFIWAVLSGQFKDVEQPKYNAYHTEVAEHVEDQ